MATWADRPNLCLDVWRQLAHQKLKESLREATA